MLFKHAQSTTESKCISTISNKELLELCYVMSQKIQEGQLTFSEDFSVSETLDGIECTLGVNEDEDVFLRADEYDEKDEAEAFIKKNPDILHAMSEIYNNYGPVEVDCSLFPTFSHQGDESGNVVYSVLPYDKRKFGQHGAVVVNEVKTWSPGSKSFVPAQEQVKRSTLSCLKEADTSKWRVYGPDTTTLNGSVVLEMTSIMEMLTDESQYQRAVAVLGNPDGNTHKNILENALAKARLSFEKTMHSYVRKSPSNFGRMNEKSNIRGGVLNVKTPSGI